MQAQSKWQVISSWQANKSRQHCEASPTCCLPVDHCCWSCCLSVSGPFGHSSHSLSRPLGNCCCCWARQGAPDGDMLLPLPLEAQQANGRAGGAAGTGLRLPALRQQGFTPRCVPLVLLYFTPWCVPLILKQQGFTPRCIPLVLLYRPAPAGSSDDLQCCSWPGHRSPGTRAAIKQHGHQHPQNFLSEHCKQLWQQKQQQLQMQ